MRGVLNTRSADALGARGADAHVARGVFWGILIAATLGQRVAARAERYVGSQEPRDCSTFVEQVYRREGVRLEGNVESLHVQARRAKALKRRPRKGDLVFFRNTYKRGLSHVGIVDHVRPDGTVTFVSRLGEGVARSKLDVRRRHDKKRNDVLRREPRALTGELLVDFADAQALRVAARRGAPSARR